MQIDIFELARVICLSIVEGLTEFIPVSSTAHIYLTEQVIGFISIPGKVFEIFIQLGAIIAIIALYPKKIYQSATGVFTNKQDKLFCAKILIAFLPCAVIWFLMYKFIKTTFTAPEIMASMLILGGIILIWIEKIRLNLKYKEIDDISLKTALKIGLCQSLAMFPGISRSGATIVGGMLLGVERKAAAEFSFFLAIPTMFAASCYDLLKNYQYLTSDYWLYLIIGFVISFFSALLIIKPFLNYVTNKGFTIFGYYRIIIGLVTLILIYL